MEQKIDYNEVVKFCFPNTELLNKHNKVQRLCRNIQLLFTIGGFALFLLFGFILPKADWRLIVLFCALGVIFLGAGISKFIFIFMSIKLLRESKKTFIQTEKDDLRSKLIEEVINNYKVEWISLLAAIIVAIGGLFCGNFFSNEIIRSLFLLLMLVVFFVILIVPTRKENKKITEIVHSLELMSYNPYDNSELYKK